MNEENNTPETIPGAFISVEANGMITGIPFDIEIKEPDQDSDSASSAV